MTYLLDNAIVALILSWIMFDIYILYKIFSNPGVKLIKGRVIDLVKETGYNSASLEMKVDVDNLYYNVEAKFRPNLRWLLQPVPTVNEEVYFYIKNDKILSENKIETVFGVNPKKVCGKSKLIYDLFNNFSKNWSILFAFAFIIVVLLINKLYSPTGDIMLYASIYWLFRVLIEGVII